jgi:hypothetical protein
MKNKGGARVIFPVPLTLYGVKWGVKTWDSIPFRLNAERFDNSNFKQLDDNIPK